MAAPQITAKRRNPSRTGKGSRMRAAIRNEARRGGGPISSEVERRLRSSVPDSTWNKRLRDNRRERYHDGIDLKIKTPDPPESPKGEGGGKVPARSTSDDERRDQGPQSGSWKRDESQSDSHDKYSEYRGRYQREHESAMCDDDGRFGIERFYRDDRDTCLPRNRTPSPTTQRTSPDAQPRPPQAKDPGPVARDTLMDSQDTDFEEIKQAVDVQIEAGNYQIVSQLFIYWSSMFHSDIELWKRFIEFETRHGTHEGWLAANAKAVGALFFDSSTNVASDRMDLVVDFIRYNKWSASSCLDMLREILRRAKNLNAREQTRLYREIYFYKLLEKGIDANRLKYGRGLTTLNKTSRMDNDARNYCFECLLLNPPSKSRFTDYIAWGFEVADYTNIRQDEGVYLRAMDLCPESIKLMTRYNVFVRGKFPHQQAEAKILDLVYRNPTYIPVGIVQKLDSYKQNPEIFRPIFYNKLSKTPGHIPSWLAAIDYEVHLRQKHRWRALCELAIEQISDNYATKGNSGNIWDRYARLECQFGYHSTYVNVLRRWLRVQPYNRLLWNQILEYWSRRHDKGAQAALYCMRHLLKGPDLDQFKREVNVSSHEHEVRWSRVTRR